MTGSTPVALDSLPCAREIFRELDSEDSTPLLYLIRGRSGTGKSTLLGAIRARLRARGVTLTDNPAHALPSGYEDSPRPDGYPATARSGPAGRPGEGAPARGFPAGPPESGVTHRSLVRTMGGRTALVIDDAHSLSPTAFDLLCRAAESGVCSVVIALRPRPHDARLRALADLVARRGRVLDLRALGATEIAPFARELGMMVPRGLAQHIHRQTAGIHGGVVAALTAACATRLDAGVAAVDTAVAAWARARLDDAAPDLLDALVVAAIGAGLDTGELTEVLDLSPTAAQDLVDRARGSALVTDADLLLTPAVAPLRTLVGDRRFLTVARRLLHARLDAGLLRDNTALLLAESGVRDPRLAEFLCASAEKAGDEAVRHYAAAAAAGANPEGLAIRWADAAARCGDSDTALRLAEPVLARASVAPADLAAAVRICAGVWTRRGLTARAAQLYTWLGPARVGPDWAVAATVLSLTGDAPGARALSATAAHWPPTGATARAGQIADALCDSISVGAPGIVADLGVPAEPGLPIVPGLPLVHAATTDFAHPAVSATPDGGRNPYTDPRGMKAVPRTNGAAARTSKPDADPNRFGAVRAPTGFTGEMQALATAPSRPTRSAAAAPAVASRRGAAVAAVSSLIQAAHSGLSPADQGGDRFLPCSAVSIAVLLSLSLGDPRRAADALRGAGRDPQSLVLGAWVAMLGGDEQSAAALLTEVDAAVLDPRDRLLAYGVAVGLARRSGDHTALALAWQQAYPLFDEVGADLLTLLPIGELWLAGIRLRDESRVSALVSAAGELLRRLDEPPAWSNAFHWYAIQAALAQESPEALLPHAFRLKTAAATGDPQAAALADAGRTWVLVLRGQVEREPVEAAVARLAGLGLSWDGARLASEAALAAHDSATATALLKLARTVRAQSRPPESPARPPVPAAPQPRPEPISDTVLSEREREVAELVLLGLTYREIGARLYISAKTVEHHVARMRRRIGAGSRSELLSMLRAMGHGSLLV